MLWRKLIFEVPDSQKKKPKRGVNQVPQKLTSSIGFLKSLQSGLSMNPKNTSMPLVVQTIKILRKKRNFEIFFFKNFFFQNFFSQDFLSVDN